MRLINAGKLRVNKRYRIPLTKICKASGIEENSDVVVFLAKPEESEQVGNNEKRRCVYCGGDKFELYSRVTDGFPYVNMYLKCSQCDHVSSIRSSVELENDIVEAISELSKKLRK